MDVFFPPIYGETVANHAETTYTSSTSTYGANRGITVTATAFAYFYSTSLAGTATVVYASTTSTANTVSSGITTSSTQQYVKSGTRVTDRRIIAYDTVYLVATGLEVAWLVTAGTTTTDYLSNIAESHTANFTLYAASYFSLSVYTSGSITNIEDPYGQGFATLTVTQLEPGYNTDINSDASIIDLFAYHQFIAGTSGVNTDTRYTEGSTTSTFGDDGSFTITFLSGTTSYAADAVTTGAVTQTIFASVYESIITEDGEVSRGSKTETTSFINTIPTTIASYGQPSLTTTIPGTYTTITFSTGTRIIASLQTNADNQFYRPTNAQGFSPLYATSFASVARGLKLSADGGLDDFYYYLPISLAARSSVLGVFFASGVQTIGCGHSVYGDVTCSINIAASDRIEGWSQKASGTVVFGDSSTLAGGLTFGFEGFSLAAAMTGNTVQGPALAHGGRQAVGDLSETMSAAKCWGRSFTINGAGGFASGVTTRPNAFQSTELASNQLRVESSSPYIVDVYSTGTIRQHNNVTFLPVFLTPLTYAGGIGMSIADSTTVYQ